MFKSVKSRLAVSHCALLALVVLVSGISLLALSIAADGARRISTKWMAASQVLGDLTENVTEFRLHELERLVAPRRDLADAAERMTKRHQARLDTLLLRYERIVGPAFAAKEREEFAAKLHLYTEEHWRTAQTMQEHRGSLDDAAIDRLQHLHGTVDEAMDALTKLTNAAAAAETEAVARSNVQAEIVLAGAAATGLVLTLTVMLLIHFRISQPLVAITGALQQLAGGRRDICVPAFDRDDEIGDIAKAFEVFRTNAVELAEAQELAHSLARHDALTGLPNRRLLSAELEASLAQIAASNRSFGIMLVDLDRFKPVNDLFGHAAGDRVICETANRLERLADKGTVARLGGDEFAILMPIAADHETAVEAAMRLAPMIIAAIGEPVLYDGHRIEIGASIGVAICPADGSLSAALLRAADLAMYRAKQAGRNAFRFFESSMDTEVREKAGLEADLRKAVREGEILALYQPVMALGSGRMHGFEVLASWPHPAKGFVPPDIFIPLAEQCGFMTELAAGILRQACRDAGPWGGDIKLAINISPGQFRASRLAESILTILTAEQFPPSRLEIEVPERALVGDIAAAKRTLSALQAAGVCVALDDFGTGYSSLHHLRDIKFDKLKIDRSFVATMLKSSESRKIVEAVLALAHSLDMPTVAEGIEDARTLEALCRQGCEFGQGILFGHAVPAKAAEHLLAEQTECVEVCA